MSGGSIDQEKKYAQRFYLSYTSAKGEGEVQVLKGQSSFKLPHTIDHFFSFLIASHPLSLLLDEIFNIGKLIGSQQWRSTFIHSCLIVEQLTYNIIHFSGQAS